ncbi:hypothetical protein JAB9_09040 [Janthinobacterium sp. HH107]|uniref:hypothetical protein n=1 Tax=Janthinobacterium sp. HH107 TaxID=1537279 RepID=UPI000893C586|nr:hypothetical protein [Janthinobacterium sp. HH107]OFA05228.1 hypothetical protein JAB9_09040 [Janthinobacterium sp. HH107]
MKNNLLPVQSAGWRLTGQDGTDMLPELMNFAERIGLNRATSGRYSFLLLLKLYGEAKRGLPTPFKVVHEIAILEGLGGHSTLKAPTCFNREPALRGLWHKHYLENGVGSMALNIRRGLKKDGIPLLKKWAAESIALGEQRYLTAADIPAIATDAVQGTLKRLQARQALTGEWIIYAVHQGVNYYLSIGRHTDADELLRNEIEGICGSEFPFILAQLTPLQK